MVHSSVNWVIFCLHAINKSDVLRLESVDGSNSHERFKTRSFIIRVYADAVRMGMLSVTLACHSVSKTFWESTKCIGCLWVADPFDWSVLSVDDDGIEGIYFVFSEDDRDNFMSLADADDGPGAKPLDICSIPGSKTYQSLALETFCTVHIYLRCGSAAWRPIPVITA